MSAQLKDLTRQKPLGQASAGQVKISYGVHNLEAAIAGKSVSEVRQALKEPLNIDPRALALVNGRDVVAAHILQAGDQLEFVRLAGEKGRDSVQPGLLFIIPPCSEAAKAPATLICSASPCNVPVRPYFLW